MASLGETSRPGFVYDQTTDTWIPIGIGSHSHTAASIGAIANTLFTAKGDLAVGTGSGTVTNRTVGSDGSLLVADSTQASGLNWAGNQVAGKNKIINGDFGIWQRGTTFSNTNAFAYFADRFCSNTDTTRTISRQTFTPGSAPVAGYEGTYYLQISKPATGTFNDLFQPIEDVRTFAGQTVTFSFWGWVSSGTQTLTGSISQLFGTGGSTAVDTAFSSVTLTTTPTRFVRTVTLPSIAGKTIGTNSSLSVYTNISSSGAFTFNTWGWQLEAGSVATAFQTATGTIQGELAACQRYYVRFVAQAGVWNVFGDGIALSTTAGNMKCNLPVQMRVSPTSVDFSTLRLTDSIAINSPITGLTIDTNESSPLVARYQATVGSGLTQYRYLFTSANNSTSSYIGFNAEL